MEGAANPDVKAMTAIASLLAGGEWMDDINTLRAAGLESELLGLRPAAASMSAFTDLTPASSAELTPRWPHHRTLTGPRLGRL